jgi:hypothetical protein
VAHCPSCDYPLPEDRERLGARCPNCRDPLYDYPGRPGRPAREGEAGCAAHPGSEAAGTCTRCGNFLCEVCRTVWRGQVVCVACVDRALASDEAAPEQARDQRRQALLGLACGAGAWVMTLGVVGLARLGAAAGTGLVFLLAALFAGSVAAALGLGQAAAALRARGGHMLAAGLGLALSGLYLGTLIGLIAFSILQL